MKKQVGKKAEMKSTKMGLRLPSKDPRKMTDNEKKKYVGDQRRALSNLLNGGLRRKTSGAVKSLFGKK